MLFDVGIFHSLVDGDVLDRNMNAIGWLTNEECYMALQRISSQKYLFQP